MTGEIVKEELFSGTHHAKVSLSADSSFEELFSTYLGASYCRMSFRNLFDSLGGGHSTPLNTFSFRLTSDIYSRIDEVASNNCPAHIKEFCDAILALQLGDVHIDDFIGIEIYCVPKLMSFFVLDQITSISHDDYSGDVFNYETASGTYISDDFLVGNCRCYAIPIVRF
jgi:hypothetical protein